MNLNKIYYDGEGNARTILQLVKQESEWAANIIQHYEIENANLKGALRTLATAFYVSCLDCPASQGECEDNKNCAQSLIAYALANPTEEVEG